MIIAALSVELYLPYAHSLKEKRMAVKGLKDALRHRHNVSVAEVDHLDLWQRATLAMVAVSRNREGCEKILSAVMREVENRFPGEVLHMATEFV